MICVSSVCKGPPLPSDGSVRFAHAMRPAIGPKRAAPKTANTSVDGAGKAGGDIDCAPAREQTSNPRNAAATNVEPFISA